MKVARPLPRIAVGRALAGVRTHDRRIHAALSVDRVARKAAHAAATRTTDARRALALRIHARAIMPTLLQPDVFLMGDLDYVGHGILGATAIG